MNHRRNFATVVILFLMLFFLINLTSIDVSAAEAVTYVGITVEHRDNAMDIVSCEWLDEAYGFPGIYAVVGTQDPAEAQKIFSTYLPACGILGTYTNDNGRIFVSVEGDALYQFIKVQQLADNWCAVNMPQIVPNGSTPEEVLNIVQNYMVKNFYNKYPGSSESENIIYISQTSLPVFYLGYGVCANLAAAYNQMVNYVPFDEQGLVNWNTIAIGHIPVTMISRQNHALSAVYVNNEWREVDITAYIPLSR